jgi:TRAP-type C4-dicarboxylate transport system substrate-binding protein
MSARALASLVFALGLGPAAMAAEVEATLSHWVPKTHPLQVLGMEPWADAIKEASGGRIEIKIFPAQRLGAAADHYEMARDGIVDIGFINPGYQPGHFPILSAAELPFQFANAKRAVRGLTEWYKAYAPQEMKDVYFCMALAHDPGTLHSKTPILVPADVKGKGVRPANATEARFISLLGGTPVQVPVPESRQVLATGVAHMMQSPWQSLYIFGVDGLVKHHLDIPLYTAIFIFIINKDFLAELSPENRKVIDEHCTPEWAEKMSAGWADVEAGGRDKIKADPTHTLYKPDAQQLRLWKAAAAPLIDEWKANIRKKNLGDPDAIYNGLVAALKKYDSYAGE